jgi:hypothetical protein
MLNGALAGSTHTVSGKRGHRAATTPEERLAAMADSAAEPLLAVPHAQLSDELPPEVEEESAVEEAPATEPTVH